MRRIMQGAALTACVLALAACVAPDDTTGSRFSQPPPGSEPRPTTDVDDIAIVGQEVSHAIMALPVVANAANPPLVQFTGVTSIVKGPVPVDTQPYTDLLRDRLLLLTREKLRFVERTLPQLVVAPPKKSKKKQAAAAATPAVSTEPDYEILAEIRGRYKDPLYRIQIEFVDIHTKEVLFDGLYRIRKEASTDATPPDQSDQPTAPPPPQAIPDPNPQPNGAPPPPPDAQQSAPPPAEGTGNAGIQ